MTLSPNYWREQTRESRQRVAEQRHREAQARRRAAAAAPPPEPRKVSGVGRFHGDGTRSLDDLLRDLSPEDLDALGREKAAERVAAIEKRMEEA